jgi:hypothetical protein
MIDLDHEMVAESLTAAWFGAKVSGEGAGRFIYAHHNERAVEISRADAGVWVEYWDGDDDYAKFDRTFEDVELGVADPQVWLSGRAE